MTPEAQCIAAAEWEGWKVRHGTELDGPCGKDDFPWTTWTAPDGKEYGDVPDYSQDLNAMHEMEAKLNVGQHERFRSHLAAITTVERYPRDLIEANSYSSQNERAYVSATAAQRLEALLRTVGLWKE